MLKKIFKKLTNTDGAQRIKPKIIKRKDHPVSRKKISQNAVKVMSRLSKKRYDTYLVGGGVRDILLGVTPKDFDVVTNAKPEEVKSIFRNCRLIGRRFRLAHVFFGPDIIEVATFRSSSEATVSKSSGMVVRDNVYGTIEDDVIRRDFTINALYYNIKDFSVVDYVGGIKDIKARKIRMIGEPAARYKEDPVRMLRAIRFAAKLGFSIDKSTAKPIYELSELLTQISEARLFEEYIKLFLKGAGFDTYKLLINYKLFDKLFPMAYQYHDKNHELIKLSLNNTDERIAEEKGVASGFLIAVFLWHAYKTEVKKTYKETKSWQDAFNLACDRVLRRQRKNVSVPVKISHLIKDMWILQFRLQNFASGKINKLFTHPKFRAAYDLLMLRMEAGEKSALSAGHFWQNYVAASPAERKRINEEQKHKALNKRKGTLKVDFDD